ncbi:MAG: D-alanyl-D-alanine carboxypeptidase family protein [Christensenellales bacterium]
MGKLKRWAAAALAATILFGAQWAFPGPVRAEELPFGVDAKAAVLMDAASGQIIYEKNADELYDVAGMIKLMSALLVSEALQSGALSLSDTVNVSSNAAGLGGMSAFLAAAQSYSVETLYQSMLMISANDATVALAEKLFGSSEAFVAKMNERARDLGLSSVFTSATGHRAPDQGMSARDAAVIARELCKHPIALTYTSIYMSELVHADGRRTELVNPNRLVRFYAGCDGLSTGSNSTAGYSGTFTAERSGTRYIAVVIGAKNSDSRSATAQKLLDHAFANYESVVVIEKGKGVAKDVPVEGGRKKGVHGVAGETLSLLLKKGEAAGIAKEVEVTDTLIAPVEAGQRMGELIIKLNGVELSRVPVVACETVEKVTIASALRAIWLSWLHL